jgi:hypothetical protein
VPDLFLARLPFSQRQRLALKEKQGAFEERKPTFLGQRERGIIKTIRNSQFAIRNYELF